MFSFSLSVRVVTDLGSTSRLAMHSTVIIFVICF